MLKCHFVFSYIISSHFQTFHTRTALPCFDEPALKATYNVTLVRRQDMTSLCNMPIIGQEDRLVDNIKTLV